MTKKEYFEDYAKTLPDSYKKEDADKYENTGFMYESGFIKSDNSFQNAYKYYLIATALGSAKAPERLGAMYHYGDGVEVNYEEALEYYQLSLERGNSLAQQMIDILKEDGLIDESKLSR